MASKFEGKDSDEEQYFEWYCEELKHIGILISYAYNPTIFPMISGCYYISYEQKKKSIKEHRYTLCQPKTYSPDFMLIWNMNNLDTLKFIKKLTDDTEHNYGCNHEDINNFFWCQNKPISMSSHIDIKPGFTKRTGDADLFSWKRSLLLEKYKINVQAVIIENLFARTFTPKRYLFNDTGIHARCKRINKKNVPISMLKDTVILEQFLNNTQQ